MKIKNVSKLAGVFSLFSTIKGKAMAKPFKAKCSKARQKL